MQTRSTLQSAAALAAFIALVLLASLFGAALQPGDWYEQLARPPLTPPNWIFGPVWSALYLCIAIAGWLVWRARGEVAIAAPLGLWGIQLALNSLWSLLFFGLQRPGLALIEITLLIALIAWTSVAFFRARTFAGVLLLPYLAWVAFACYLNAGFWYLNR